MPFSKHFLIPLTIIVLLSLAFGLWGAYQLGRMSVYHPEIQRETTVFDHPFHFDGKARGGEQYPVSWHFGIAGIFFGLVFLLCFFGIIGRMIRPRFWQGCCPWPNPDNRRGCRRNWKNQ